MHVQAAWHGTSGPTKEGVHVSEGGACKALSRAYKTTAAQLLIATSWHMTKLFVRPVLVLVGTATVGFAHHGLCRAAGRLHDGLMTFKIQFVSVHSFIGLALYCL